MAASPAPEGRRVLAPYLAADDAAEAIDFYQRAFGATERSRIPGPAGTIAHVELELWGMALMLADPLPQFITRPPKEVGATTVSMFAYVDDVDAVFRRAIDAGATSNTEPVDMFWGDRFATLTDPFGHAWHLATQVEDVPPEELAERSKAAMAAMGG